MQYINNFLQYINSVENLSKNTIESYNRDLKKMYDFFTNKNVSILELKTKDLEEYLKFLKTELSPRSIARNISSIKHFYDYLQTEGILDDNPSTLIENLKINEHLPDFLTEEETILLLNKSKEDKSNFGIKFNCMLQVLYATGMRVSELVSLKIDAIDTDYNANTNKFIINNFIRIIGKGNKERIVPLNNEAIKSLSEYIDLRKKLLCGNFSNWLFTNMVNFSKKEKQEKILFKKDCHITRQVFARELKDIAVSIGIDANKIHPHTLRHSIASHLLKNGADLKIIQEILGHSDITTTQIYTHINNKKLVDAVYNNHPLNNLIEENSLMKIHQSSIQEII